MVLGYYARSITLVSACLLTSCSGLHRDARIGIAAVTAGVAVASQIPSSEIEQLYYLGVFDPQSQLPSAIYRIRVRGQASGIISQTRYASGWVRAELMDSLATVAAFNAKTGDVEVRRTSEEQGSAIAKGRRLVMFGPEGFREAPKDHRLVIVMGSSPEKFFSAIDETLGVVAMATQGQGNPALSRDLFRELLRLRTERDKLEEIRIEVKEDTMSGRVQ